MGGAVIRFRSTRQHAPLLSLSQALLQGLAVDGGLYVPETWPPLAAAPEAAAELPEVASWLLAPFFAGDALEGELAAIAQEAFSFPAPLRLLDPSARLSVLELFHGPTAAFKDFGARFLSACLGRLRQGSQRPLTVLVATSGDTGGAVAAAFHGRPGIHVAVLFPKGLVSPTQQQQLTCWGGNVRAFAVRGTFDDCQRLVKEAFKDEALSVACELSSANSINLGRLLPQMVYYAQSSLALAAVTGQNASYVIPSGNLGNAQACLWARALGAPIGEVVLAHNANRTVPEYIESGAWTPRRSVATLASAMDVGDPSNMERLRDLYPTWETLAGAVSACSIDDDAIRARIAAVYREHGQIWCPHTATAAEAYERTVTGARRERPWVLVATAHAAKFPEIVEPLIGRSVPVPEALAKLFARPTEHLEIEAQLPVLREVLLPGEATWKIS
jgi:threonine synthase